MKQGTIFLLAAALAMTAGISAAQVPLGPGGGQQRGPMAYCPWMADYTGQLSSMMNDMQQMMKQSLTPEQQTQLLEMVNQMGSMMHQMCGPRAYRLQPLFGEQLQDMQKRLDAIKGQLKSKQ